MLLNWTTMKAKEKTMPVRASIPEVTEAKTAMAAATVIPCRYSPR